MIVFLQYVDRMFLVSLWITIVSLYRAPGKKGRHGKKFAVFGNSGNFPRSYAVYKDKCPRMEERGRNRRMAI